MGCRTRKGAVLVTRGLRLLNGPTATMAVLPCLTHCCFCHFASLQGWNCPRWPKRSCQPDENIKRGADVGLEKLSLEQLSSGPAAEKRNYKVHQFIFSHIASVAIIEATGHHRNPHQATVAGTNSVFFSRKKP